MTFKSIAFAVSASVALFISVAAAHAQGYTTRIEPRPFYGAVVTLEEGVRVIRPLPPERHVIINPGNATPLSLGFNETRVYENRTIRNYNYNDGGSSSGDSSSNGSYGRSGFYGPSFVTGGGKGHYRGHVRGHGRGHVHGHRGHHRMMHRGGHH